VTVRQLEFRDETRLIRSEPGVVGHGLELRQGVHELIISRLRHLHARLVQADALGQQLIVAAVPGVDHPRARVAEFGARKEVSEIGAAPHDGHQVRLPIEVPRRAGQRPELMALSAIEDESRNGRLLGLRRQ
jgi:hypothetical protein